jgi:hypothetical protein
MTTYTLWGMSMPAKPPLWLMWYRFLGSNNILSDSVALYMLYMLYMQQIALLKKEDGVYPILIMEKPQPRAQFLPWQKNMNTTE